MLVGGDWNHGISWLSIHLGISSSPTDFHSIIFQRGRLKPPTRAGKHGIVMDPRWSHRDVMSRWKCSSLRGWRFWASVHPPFFSAQYNPSYYHYTTHDFRLMPMPIFGWFSTCCLNVVFFTYLDLYNTYIYIWLVHPFFMNRNIGT